MISLDLIVRNGMVIGETDAQISDISVAAGKIVAIEKNLAGKAAEIINASGLHIFPGVIDAHVHFNEPGRADWEGIETGSRSIAAGGGTMFFDMPLNAHPPTLDAASFKEKRALAEAKSLVDFALWGGLVPENLDKLEELAQCGVIGFKAFMCNSGIGDFSGIGEADLREGMKRVARLKLPVAVHAENEALTAKLAAEAQAGNRTGIRDYLESRPIKAELEAIARAIEFSGETGCSLHIVHVSSAAGVQLITQARQRGVDVTCETCPHYILLTDEDVEKLGAVAKCSPPLRSPEEQDKLRRELFSGNIQTVGSDHSPSPPEMKQSVNFFKVWGGISGAQHLLPILLTIAGQNNFPVSKLAKLFSWHVADRFNLPKTKGRIAAGCDADFALVDLEAEFTVEPKDLMYRHQQSPYVGKKLRGVVKRTFLRGQTVFADGKISHQVKGELVTPSHFHL